MSAPKHSSPATKEALHRILKSAFTAKDVADLLPSVDAQTPISQARQLLQELGCPILGVKEHGLYVGWLDAQDTERSGTCREILRPFNERPILHESAPFRDVVLALAQNSPVFVTVMGETAAAICPCDLQDAPMRMWLFGLITLMETLMQRALSGQLPEGQWQAYISPGRLRRAQELYAERLRRHVVFRKPFQPAVDRGVMRDDAAAPFFDRSLIKFIFGIEQVHFPMIGIYMSVPPVSRWINTVKEIHSPVNSFQYISRCSHSHQIGRLVLREISDYSVQNAIHLLMAFANSKTAYCISVQVQFCNLLRVFDPDIFIHASLIDAEKHLMRIDCIRKRIQSCHLILAPFQPSGCTCHRISHILPVGHT